MESMAHLPYKANPWRTLYPIHICLLVSIPSSSSKYNFCLLAMALVAGDEAMSMSWHDVGVVVDPDEAGTAPFDAAAGYVPSYDQCQYYHHHHHPCTTELIHAGDAGSAVALEHDVDGWVHAAAAATSPSSSSVLTFDGHGEEHSAVSWMDMDAHATEPQLIGYGLTAATSSSSCCFSSGGFGDSGMVMVTTTPTSAAVSGSHKRARAPASPSQGAELQENSKKQRANNKEPQSSAAKSRREKIGERLRALQELVPSGAKVDMVSMLDRAISYVKFMQLQLRVLETDAFWPAADGAAPDIPRAKDALDAIILSSSSPSQMACPRSG
uniref:BHLH domain-containing protein n=1 Tax=Oryza punctata TaxID=4537 RepID=A0A0E0LBX0_ORYPU